MRATDCLRHMFSLLRQMESYSTRDEGRIKKYQDGTHDGSVDLLLTGCEVSLWLLEQFASDLAQV